MQKVIGKRVFDTDTAERICGIRCTVYGGDFGWHGTNLHRTARAQWFLAGEGNASSMWGRQGVGGVGVPRDSIRLMPDDEAREILEAERMDHLIEDFFEVIEG